MACKTLSPLDSHENTGLMRLLKLFNVDSRVESSYEKPSKRMTATGRVIHTVACRVNALIACREPATTLS